MKIHKRETRVRAAESDLREAILDVLLKYKDLTWGEELRVLCSVFDNIGSLAKHKIRQERHPDDPEKPGGLE